MTAPYRQFTSEDDPMDRFEEIIARSTDRKSVTKNNLNAPGGMLDAELQKAFVKILMQSGKTPLLDAARWIDFGPNPKARVDKIFLGRPFLRKIPNEGDVVSFSGGVQFGGFEIDAVRVEGSDYVSKNAMRRNIEKGRLQQTLIELYARKARSDMEKVGVSGNTGTSGTDANAMLLKSANGWGIALQKSLQHKCGGAQISQGILDAMYRKQASAFRDGVVWAGHSNLLHAYKNFLESRIGDVPTQLLVQQNGGLKPGGLPFLTSEAFDVMKSVPTTAATSAVVIAKNQGPYRITADKRYLLIDVNNLGSGTGTLIDLRGALPANQTEGTLEASVLAQYANAALKTAFPSADAIDQTFDVSVEGFLVLRTKATGTTAEIDIQATGGAETGLEAYSEIGLTVAVTTGAAAGNNTVKSGTELWLTNPQNLLWGAVENVEMYFKHEPRRDGYELIMFLEYAFAVENPQAATVCPDIMLPFLA